VLCERTCGCHALDRVEWKVEDSFPFELGCDGEVEKDLAQAAVASPEQR
jgi:hypothetical protein